MLELAILVKKSTLAALEEHSSKVVGGSISFNEYEALVLLKADTLSKLLSIARPEDTRIDEVIMRLAL